LDIKKIPMSQLLKDKEESIIDILVCEKALSLGVIHYSGGLTQERLDANKRIVIKIDKELLRR